MVIPVAVSEKQPRTVTVATNQVRLKYTIAILYQYVSIARLLSYWPHIISEELN